MVGVQSPHDKNPPWASFLSQREDWLVALGCALQGKGSCGLRIFVDLTPDPSEDPALTKWMREQRGPDAFYMRTDGAERYASVYSTYEGQCTYSFNIRLKNPGNVYVSIWWTYEVCLSFVGLLELELMKKNIAIHGILRNQCIMASNAFQLS